MNGDGPVIDIDCIVLAGELPDHERRLQGSLRAELRRALRGVFGPTDTPGREERVAALVARSVMQALPGAPDGL